MFSAKADRTEGAVVEFAELMQRVHERDQVAATELVERFGPQLQRAISREFGRLRLQAVTEREDIAQSSFRALFAAIFSREVVIESAAHLQNYLAQIAHFKMLRVNEEENCRKRDRRRTEELSARHLDSLVGCAASALDASIFAEELQDVAASLTPPERRIAEMRVDRATWADVAAELGVSAAHVRKVYLLAVDRARATLRR